MAGSVRSANEMSDATPVDADFCIAGSGAGGGVCALLLAKAGFKVVVLEEGPNIPYINDTAGTQSGLNHKQPHVRPTLNELESKMYGMLYQEGAGRQTLDGMV